MSLSKFVKIANVSNLSDARYCAGMMVDILGFEISNPQSEHFVDKETFNELTQWVAGVSFAGECHNTTFEFVQEIISKYQVQYLELNQLDILKQVDGRFDKLLIFKLSLHAGFDPSEIKSILEQADDYAELIIIDCQKEVNTQAVEALIGTTNLKSNLLRSYDLDTHSVTQLSPFWYGIELQASIEEQAGYKDYGIVMDILEQIEED
jgi:phosphoribosylanthranilate isomerase